MRWTGEQRQTYRQITKEWKMLKLNEKSESNQQCTQRTQTEMEEIGQ